MTSSRIFRPVSGPNPARKNSAKNAPVLCQVRHALGHSLFSFCVKKGRQNGPYSQLHFCGFKPSHALSIPAYRLHIADIPPTRSSPTAILIYPDPLYPSSAQNGPAATLVCHPECAPARSLAQGEAHAASAPHGLGNVRALPFSWSCKTPSSASGKSGRRRLTCAA